MMGQLLMLSSLFGMGPRHSDCVIFGAVEIHMYTACLCPRYTSFLFWFARARVLSWHLKVFHSISVDAYTLSCRGITCYIG